MVVGVTMSRGGVLLVVVALDALLLLYYAFEAEAITTLAHLCAIDLLSVGGENVFDVFLLFYSEGFPLNTIL